MTMNFPRKMSVFPISNYGVETWVVTKGLTYKKQIHQRAIERRMSEIKLKDRKWNSWIGQNTKEENGLDWTCC